MDTEQIKFYKEQIGKFSNVDYSIEGYYTKTAKGKLIAVSEEGEKVMLLIQGDHKSWSIDVSKVINSSFLEWKEGGSKNE